jgi:hypothetical protein
VKLSNRIRAVGVKKLKYLWSIGNPDIFYKNKKGGGGLVSAPDRGTVDQPTPPLAS